MANEGSTKPTYSELEAEIERVRGLLQRRDQDWRDLIQDAIGQWGGPQFKYFNEAMARIWDAKKNFDKGLDLWGDPLDEPTNSETTVSPTTANKGIAGTSSADKTVEYSSQNPNFPQSSSLVSQGAESADIGKLDSAHEIILPTGISVHIADYQEYEAMREYIRQTIQGTADKSGKVNRVDEKCVAGCEFNGGHQAEHPCGKKLSDAAPLSTLLSLLKAENVQAAIDQLRRDGYRNVCNALADSVMELDDEQIIQETKDAGLDPVAEAERVRQIIQRAAGSAETGGEKDDDELKELRDLPDDKIDTSDIPEVTDWSKAERGKFYKPPGPELREPEKLNNAPGEKCFVCREWPNPVAGDPMKWPVRLPYANGNGKLRTYCTKCVVEALAESSLSQKLISTIPEDADIHNDRQPVLDQMRVSASLSSPPLKCFAMLGRSPHRHECNLVLGHAGEHECECGYSASSPELLPTQLPKEK